MKLSDKFQIQFNKYLFSTSEGSEWRHLISQYINTEKSKNK